MKKLLSYALVAILLFSAVMGIPQLGPFGVDTVSAATGDTTPVVPKTTTYLTASEITRLLVDGSNGSDVKLLQTMLNNNGYTLKVDGMVGPKTLAKLYPIATTPIGAITDKT